MLRKPGVIAIAFILLCARVDADTLTYGIPHYPPNSVVSDNAVSGFDIEIVTLLAEKVGFNLVMLPCSWERCIQLAKKGQIDLLSSVGLSQDRQSFLHYIKPGYNPSGIVFITRNQDRGNIRSYGDLKGKNIGIETGARHFHRFDNDTSLDKYESDNHYVLLRMLASKRIDVLICADKIANYLLAKQENQNQFALADYHYEGMGYLALSKSSKLIDYLTPIQEAMNELEQENILHDIVNSEADFPVHKIK